MLIRHGGSGRVHKYDCACKPSGCEPPHAPVHRHTHLHAHQHTCWHKHTRRHVRTHAHDHVRACAQAHTYTQPRTRTHTPHTPTPTHARAHTHNIGRRWSNGGGPMLQEPLGVLKWQAKALWRPCGQVLRNTGGWGGGRLKLGQPCMCRLGDSGLPSPYGSNMNECVCLVACWCLAECGLRSQADW